MKFDLDKFETLPLRGKTSIMAALNPEMRNVYYDWDLSNNARAFYSKAKAKNSKAKHRKKYRRRG